LTQQVGMPCPGRDITIIDRRFNAGKSRFRIQVPEGALEFGPVPVI
jgi:hypothetical protein